MCFFSSRRRHTRYWRDWSSDVCSSDLPVTRHWLSRLPSPYTADDARAHLEQMTEDAASGHSLCWAVAAADDDRLVGEIALFGLAEPSRSSEVGYWGHPAERGRGFLTEATRPAARHALLPVDRSEEHTSEP